MATADHSSWYPLTVRERMAATGIGFAGIDGAWWLPAARPFPLPDTVRLNLLETGAAIFALLDVLNELVESDPTVQQLLSFKSPEAFRRLSVRAPALMVRPDFQLCPTDDGLSLVATEIEVCPAALGFAHAMQVGYGLACDLADWFAGFLRGRPLIIVASAQWSEFLFDLLAFCRALGERGARAYVHLDTAIATIAAEVAGGSRWVPPMFGVPERPEQWDTDLLGRIRSANLADYIWTDDELPSQPSETVIYRFGYFDCFAPEKLALMRQWQLLGATFLNPLTYYLENKAVLAAAMLPAVQESLRARNADYPARLAQCLPETHVISPDTFDLLCRDHERWVLKYAGYDGGNQAWGGRSLVFGRDMTASQWQAVLQQSAALDWPVVAQRLSPSLIVDIDYLDGANAGRSLRGTTRLRAFLLRDGDDVAVGGAHITVSATDQVSEAVDAVQAPVSFVYGDAS